MDEYQQEKSSTFHEPNHCRIQAVSQSDVAVDKVQPLCAYSIRFNHQSPRLVRKNAWRAVIGK